MSSWLLAALGWCLLAAVVVLSAVFVRRSVVELGREWRTFIDVYGRFWRGLARDWRDARAERDVAWMLFLSGLAAFAVVVPAVLLAFMVAVALALWLLLLA